MSSDFRLSISDEAKKEIATLRRKHKLRYNKEGIPAIMWIDSALNDGIIDSQPAIGFYTDRDEIAPADLLTLDGIEIAFAVADEDIFRFQDKTLGYEVDRFVLR